MWCRGLPDRSLIDCYRCGYDPQPDTERFSSMLELLPWLIAMGLLILLSGFCSSSEAALFLLSPQDQRSLREGSRAEQRVAKLLADPDRLLTAVLFCNLVVNVAYFAIASISAMRLQQGGRPEWAGAFTFASLMVIIFCSEMLPKSVAVLNPRRVATLVASPLTALVRSVDVIAPILKWSYEISRRLVWPRLDAEPYLEITDLERAVELSTADAALLQHEKTVLQNIVSLSNVRVDELMRPRVQFLSFRPPVAIRDLKGRTTPSGYVLVEEADTDEIAAAIPIKSLAGLPRENLERHAQQVFYVPWCISAAQALERMLSRTGQVAAVINEFGETIGILTYDDILDSIFTTAGSRSERLLKQTSIQSVGSDVWQVTGMTTLRRLARRFGKKLPETKSMTVAGAVQESLGHVPQPGDACEWGPFHFEVVSVPERGQMVLELRFTRPLEIQG